MNLKNLLNDLKISFRSKFHWHYLLYFTIPITLLYGVTLLALGNGAADVFSSLSAGGSDTTSVGFYLAASSCLGSGMFVSTIISSAITLMTN